ncbi:hypothetical protein [Aquabacterium humicola]|uniref:hypothetical protein n=1 Tax=Aquabacterium humicola TaxID=3237377 RepID=UPI002542C724|nr:hypothetical protein [Rubrivivax pictus]
MTAIDVALIPLMGLIAVVIVVTVLAVRSRPAPDFIESEVGDDLAAALLLTSCNGCGVQLPERLKGVGQSATLCDDCSVLPP